jgi:hypothetical protein
MRYMATGIVLLFATSAMPQWPVLHPAFGEALKVGKKEADDRVERSLYHRAVGYSYEAVKIFLPYGSKEPIYAPYVEHVPPDTTACIFWLKNRKPEMWRDAWQLEHVTGRYVISDKPRTEEQWIAERGATWQQRRRSTFSVRLEVH